MEEKLSPHRSLYRPINETMSIRRADNHSKSIEESDPPDPEPEPVAKKKTKKPRVLSNAVRVKLIKSRHKALLKDKKRREERMDRKFGAAADAEDWSEDQ